MLGTSLIVARMTTIEEFGIYSLMLTTLLAVTGVAQGSSGVVATKFVAESLNKDPQGAARVLTVCARSTLASGICCFAMLLGMSHVLAVKILHKPMVEIYFRWVALAVIFQVLLAYQQGALQAFGAYRRIGFTSILSGILHLAASVAGAALNGIEGAIQGLVVSAVGRAIVVSFVLRKTLSDLGIKKATSVSRSDWCKIWAFALPASLAGLVTLPSVWAVSLIVACQPNGLAWSALFSVANQIKQAILLVPSLLNIVTFATLSRMKEQKKIGEFRQIFLSSVTLSVGFTAGVVFITLALGTNILSLFSNEFVAGIVLMRILLLASILEVLSSAIYQLVQSHGCMWHSLLIIALPRDIGYIAFAALGIYALGLPGVGLAYLLAQTMGVLLTLWVLRILTRGEDMLSLGCDIQRKSPKPLQK